jgi:hypothetical protein
VSPPNDEGTYTDQELKDADERKVYGLKGHIRDDPSSSDEATRCRRALEGLPDVRSHADAYDYIMSFAPAEYPPGVLEAIKVQDGVVGVFDHAMREAVRQFCAVASRTGGTHGKLARELGGMTFALLEPVLELCRGHVSGTEGAAG